ncbi:MAG: hypothetical protein ACRDQX_02980 [Pseudonocardiaceae bacterium]
MQSARPTLMPRVEYSEQLAQRHLADALDIGLPGDQPDDLRMCRRQVKGFFHAHDPFTGRHTP